jgi:aerobic-type carbon monoxide dehydrogenase small subunit (CoxS/CutS family)
MKIEFEVNGMSVQLETSPVKRLLDILRDDLDLIATKEGCGKGECGSCTVLLNGKRVNSCLIPALQVNGSRVFTLEGMQKWPVFKAVEDVFIEKGAVQCGFCIPGMVVSTMAFLNEAKAPFSEDQIKWAIAGNMCRCTGYTKIIDTISELGNHKTLVTQLRKDWPE